MEWLVQALAADSQQGQAWPWAAAPLSSGWNPSPFYQGANMVDILLTSLLHGYKVKELVIQRHGG